MIPRNVPFDDEDRQPGVTTALGPVGGRILLEVLNGILINDDESVLASPDSEGWIPMVNGNRKTLTLWDIFAFAGENM